MLTSLILKEVIAAPLMEDKRTSQRITKVDP